MNRLPCNEQMDFYTTIQLITSFWIFSVCSLTAQQILMSRSKDDFRWYPQEPQSTIKHSKIKHSKFKLQNQFRISFSIPHTC